MIKSSIITAQMNTKKVTMKNAQYTFIALLLAPLAALYAADARKKTQPIRLLAKLPSISVSFKMEFQITEFGLDKTNAAPRVSESSLRETLKTTPTNATAWCTLGAQLLGRAMRDHLHAENINGENIPKLLAALQSGRLTREDIQHARQLMDEALGCYAKAIASAPEESDGYLQRLGCRLIFRTCLQLLDATLEGKPPSQSQPITPDTFDDFQQAARLCPDNVKLQATFLIYLAICDAAAKRDGSILDEAFATKSRTAIAEARSRLETLTACKNPGLAAQACEGLAIPAFMFGSAAEAQKLVQRAVTLDPARDSAWELLASVQIRAERRDDLLTVCTERVKAADTIRNRYFLAKAYEQLDQFDKTAEQLDLILKREPDNFLATTGRAAILLRCSDDAKATEFLQRAAKLANDITEPAQRADLFTLQAISETLIGDRKTAELYLGQALKLDENNKNARAVRSELSVPVK